ncbi:type II secretion system protein [Candidatus Parcubacteria bacterium]|jgi:prepilin-type N-terminal cleavage/methylation domain-containing protein|nr:type II secretion system protein [Candidatus Parcubacteria bacterium]
MKNNKGFTLVELLVVIAIIGILSSIAVVQLNVARDKARVAALQASVDPIWKYFNFCLSGGGNLYYNGSARVDGGPGRKSVVVGTEMCSNDSDLIWLPILGQTHYEANYDMYSGIFLFSFEIGVSGLAQITCFENAGCATTVF